MAGLIGIQVYRVLGVIFLILYAHGALPGVFALPAGIGDIAVGITAPLVAYLSARGATYACLAALSWNLFGIADLIAAVTLGFLSSPSPFQQVAFEHPNELITAFPLVMIPVFAVPLSLLLHLASLQKLRHPLRQPVDARKLLPSLELCRR